MSPILRGILGREPALAAGITSLIIALLTAHAINVTGTQQALILAGVTAVFGIAVAVIASDGLPAALTALAQSAIAIYLGFGLHWSPIGQGPTLAALALISAAFVRTQIGAPVAKGAPSGRLF